MMNRRKLMRPIIVAAIILFAAALLSIFIANRVINHASEGKLYSTSRSIPHNKVGLLLGTGKYLSNGSLNPYYQYRIEAAAELMKAGKIDYLVVSGDNSRKDYNEPQMMKTDLLRYGLDSGRIYLDYAGFRTFDSMIRLKEIFGQDSATIISQPFHNQRAIYIARRKGITAIGFNARDVSRRQAIKVTLREKLARVRLFLDLFFGATPKYLGPKISIP